MRCKVGETTTYSGKNGYKNTTLADTIVSNKGRCYGAGVLLRCPIKSSGLRFSSILSTAATRSGRFICHRQRSPRSPDSHLRFESDRHSKKADTRMGICFFGAGDRTRTGTLSPAVDFESTTSTNSITPAGAPIVYTIFFKMARVNFIKVEANCKAVDQDPLQLHISPKIDEISGSQ